MRQYELWVDDPRNFWDAYNTLEEAVKERKRVEKGYDEEFMFIKKITPVEV